MRLTISVLFLALMCALVPSTRAQPPGDPDAAEPGEPITGLVAFDNALVAVGPDFAYSVIGQLPVNASVTVLGRRGDLIATWDGRQWLEVEFGGSVGWVYARLIRTSVPFNSIPPSGIGLPRDRNGRVPEVFDLTRDFCDDWQGEFTRSGDFLNGDTELVVTYPALEGAEIYSVIVISPDGRRTAFDSYSTTAVILLDRLPAQPGTYTWRVAPYWTNDVPRYTWQQVCLLRTGGTFERP